MGLFVAILARNEAGLDRHLRSVLASCESFADEVLVLDDQSTDDTGELCKGFGCTVQRRSPSVPPAWGNEAPARAELWELAHSHCRDARDWVLFADADMILHGDPRPLCGSRETNAWSFILYDVWSLEDQTYRSDGFWQGHAVPRPWLVAPKRVPNGWVADWNVRNIHCGHIAPNFPLLSGIAPPDEYYWLHLAYATDRLRAEKHKQYMSKRHLLTPFEVEHAESILAPA